MSSSRSRLLVLCLSATFALLAQSAFASHFRYGYMFWERDLSYVNLANPNQVRVIVTVEAGGRWTYPAFTPATLAGFTFPTCSNNISTNNCCTGAVLTGSTGTGSCPPVGALINFVGSTTGTLVFDRAVTITNKHGVTLGTPINVLAGGSVPMDVIVNQVVGAQDTFYGRFTFTMLMDRTLPTRVVWEGNARVSQLLDSNNDRLYHIESTINLSDPSVTKSPKTQAPAMMLVFSSVNNVITLPSQTFDNTVARWRLATAAESGLFNTTPPSPSIFSLNPALGVVNFNPRANGFYAVQFILEAVNKDNPNDVKATVPLDVMFMATSPTEYSHTLAIGDGQTTTYTATALQQLTFTVTATTSPTPPTGYTAQISPGVLPPGAAFGQPFCNGATCTGTFTWTPSVTSTGQALCFVSTLVNGVTSVATSPTKCVTIDMTPLQTALDAYDAQAPVNGGPITLKARLTRVLQTAPLANRKVRFTYVPSPATPPWVQTTNALGVDTVLTDLNGDATLVVTPTGPAIPGAKYLARFDEIAGELAESFDEANYIAPPATTALSALVANTTDVVGNTLQVSTTLTRTSVPAGVIGSAAILFTLTGAAGNPGGPSTSTVTATTAADGSASATFPLSARGQFTITASYAGSPTLSSASRTGDLTVYQRTQLSLGAAHGVATDPTSITAALRDVPQNTPIPGATVSFDFQGSGVASGSAATDSNGAATISRVFPTPGTFAMTASFSDVAGFYADDQGNPIPSTSTEQATIASVTTSLAAPVIGNSFVGDSITVSTVLSRVTIPTGPLGGSPITFDLTAPSGAVTTQSAVTNANGEAAGTFTFSERGAHTIAVSYAGTIAIQPSSTTVSFNVYQKTSITVTATSGYTVDSFPVKATLINLPQNTPVVGQTIQFSFGPSSVPPLGAPSTGRVTDATGVATWTINGPLTASSYFARATLDNAGAFYANQSGQIAPETAVASFGTVLTPTVVSLEAPGSALVGVPFNLSAFVKFISAETSEPMANTQVTFTVQSPDSSMIDTVTTTDANGLATISVTPAMRNMSGSFARIGGTPLYRTSTSSGGETLVYQRTAMSVESSGGIAGAPIQVKARLITVPGGAPIDGQAIDFTFTGADAPAPQSGVTDANGYATVTVTSTQSFTAQASFLNADDYFTNTAGAIPPAVLTASGAVTVTRATTTLAVTAPAAALVGGVSSAIATLTRGDGQAIGSQPITFTFTDPGGATTELTGTTTAAGIATVSLTPAQRGAASVSASFAGNTSYLPSSNTAAFSVYQRTQLTAPNVASGAAGSPMTLTATLTTVPGGAPIANQPVQFSFGGVLPPQMAMSNGAGTATVSITAAEAGWIDATASFLNAADFFTNDAGAFPPAAETASTGITVTAAATALSTVSGPAVAVDGSQVVFSTTLTRGDGLPIGAGRTVEFTVTLPDGSTLGSVPSVTDANGTATRQFATGLRGVYSITASFAGDAALAPSTAAPATLTNYQRANVRVGQPNNGVAGAPITIQARVGGASNIPVGGQPVEFTFSGGVPSQNAVTDNNGIASVQVVFAGPGTFTAQASFLNPVDFFTNHTGDLPPAADTWSEPVMIVAAETALSAISVPGNGLVGSPIAVIATLSRADAIGLPAGAQVTFSVTGPDGSITQLIGATDATGLASVSFTPGARGVHSVTASFAGTSALVASASSTTPSFTVYQRAALVLPPATGQAARPASVTAILTNVPSGAPSAGQTVTFSFSGPGAPASTSATTNAAGIASVSVTFPSVAFYTTTASFSNAAGLFTNQAGELPAGAEVASGSVDVTNNAPTFTAPANITAEATGPSGRVVSYTAMGNDVEDGPRAAVCTPLTSPSTFPLGTTTINCTVTDGAGATATGSFTVTIEDTTAPALTLPANITTDPTGPSGAAVSFTATATDIVTIPVTPVCAPASATTFAIGTTIVNCTATDGSNNIVSGSFTITVRNPTQATENLQQMAATAGMSQGDNNVDNVLKFLNQQSGGSLNAACNNLNSVINKAQRMGAAGLPIITAAQNLKATIGCTP